MTLWTKWVLIGRQPVQNEKQLVTKLKVQAGIELCNLLAINAERITFLGLSIWEVPSTTPWAYGAVEVQIRVSFTSVRVGGKCSAARENSLPYRDANSDPSAVQPVASRYTDCANFDEF